MGTDKLLFEYRGKSLLQRSVDLLSELPVYERIVVTTNVRLKQITLPSGIRSCINPYPERGISSSIHIGAKAAAGTHYFFLTADQPLLTLHDVGPLLEAASRNPDKIVFPVIHSKPCSPTLFPERFREELLSLKGDTGGRAVRDAHKNDCYAIEPEFPENFIDIDFIEDFKRIVHVKS